MNYVVKMDNPLLAKLTKNSVKVDPIAAILTPRQKEVYDFILEHRERYQTLPSITEITVAMGYSSHNAAYAIRQRLMDRGVLKPSFNSVGYIVTALEK